MTPVLSILNQLHLGEITVEQAMERLEPFIDVNKANRDWYEAQLKKPEIEKPK